MEKNKLCISFVFANYTNHHSYTVEGKVIGAGERGLGSHWWLQSSLKDGDEQKMVFRLWHKFCEKKTFWIKFALVDVHGIESIVFEPGEQIGDETLRSLEWDTNCTRETFARNYMIPENNLQVVIDVDFDDPLLIAEKTRPKKKMNNLLRLFLDEQLCDFKIVVNKREVNTHKVVLGSESTVFMAMFDSDMKERRENCLQITDFSFESVYAMIKFMYCHEIDDIEDITSDLLALAEKYDIKELKIHCERYLYSTMSKENCLDFLEMAETYNTIFLKDKIFKDIHEKWPEIKGTERWKLLSNDYQELCGKLSQNVKI